MVSKGAFAGEVVHCSVCGVAAEPLPGSVLAYAPVLNHVVHVLVAASTEVHQHGAGAHLAGGDQGMRDGVRGQSHQGAHPEDPQCSVVRNVGKDETVYAPAGHYRLNIGVVV